MIDVIHHCYISLAREIWKKPILFYHKLEKKDIQKNHIEINNLIKHSIKVAIKDLLPFKEILTNYLDNDNSDSESDYEDDIVDRLIDQTLEPKNEQLEGKIKRKSECL